MSDETNILSEILKTLIEQDTPMSAEEIAERIRNDSSTVYTTKNLGASIRSSLSKEIIDNKNSSLFARFSKGMYGLRNWLNSGEYKEYHPVKRKKNPIDEVIAVIPAEKLGLLVSSSGFHAAGIPEEVILREFESCIRHRAEERLDLVQFVSVFIVHDGERVVTHKRAKRLPESRLHDEYSVMFGGHVLSEDLSSLFNPFDVVSQSGFILRELEEEIHLGETSRVTPVGLIYDDSRDVSKQHIGLVFTVRTNTGNYTIGEKGFLVDHRVESISDIKNRIADFENWSVTLINNFDEILSIDSGNNREY